MKNNILFKMLTKTRFIFSILFWGANNRVVNIPLSWHDIWYIYLYNILD